MQVPKYLKYQLCECFLVGPQAYTQFIFRGKAKCKHNFVDKKIVQGTFKFCQLVQEDQCAAQGVILTSSVLCFYPYKVCNLSLRQIMRFWFLLKLCFIITVMSNHDGVVGATLIAGVNPKFKPQAADSDTEFNVVTKHLYLPTKHGISVT